MDRVHCHWPLLDTIDLLSWTVTADTKHTRRGTMLAITDRGGDDMLAQHATQVDLQDDLGQHIENPGNPEGIRASEETAKSN